MTCPEYPKAIVIICGMILLCLSDLMAIKTYLKSPDVTRNCQNTPVSYHDGKAVHLKMITEVLLFCINLTPYCMTFSGNLDLWQKSCRVVKTNIKRWWVLYRYCWCTIKGCNNQSKRTRLQKTTNTWQGW